MFFIRFKLPAPTLEFPDDGEKLFARSLIMRRSLLGLVLVAVLSACNDSPPVTGMTSPNTISMAKSPPVNSLDESIYAIIALWPKGHSNAILSQWIAIKGMYAEGDLAGANAKLADLAAFILKKSPGMSDPPGGESKNAAAARLLSYMVLFLGGETEAPPAGTDNAAGLLTPDAPLTLITPSGHAGTQFEEGSVAENRLIVITQNAASFDFCDGPLPTTRCQYPLFYDIKSIPDGSLLKPGVADMCLDPHPFEHDDLLLAKPDASNPSVIELLAESSVPEFIDCSDIGGEEVATDRSLLGRVVHIASAIASRVGKLLAPKSAYAIDQGGGGEFGDFGSPFNWVGPDGCEIECFPSAPTP